MVRITITSASVSGNTATLNFAGLPEDVYRLIVKDTITDVAGNSLDGDANRTVGGAWRRDFVVNALGDIELDNSFDGDGKLIRLFHPRKDVWSDHFAFEGHSIRARSDLGDGTRRLLGFNDLARIQERQAMTFPVE